MHSKAGAVRVVTCAVECNASTSQTPGIEDAAHPDLAKQTRACIALGANPSPTCQVKENVEPADLIRQANLEQNIQPAWSQKRVFNHVPTIRRSDDENVFQLIDAVENWSISLCSGITAQPSQLSLGECISSFATQKLLEDVGRPCLLWAREMQKPMGRRRIACLAMSVA
ncbi:hypothetical protein CH63R_09620 [Colletotrichum higginsianum IMI 349063]|uniref:Uncharacterized protein n=1 Tax=Colletotrichum higginsianum (strain IMI 349063) TaxID=759273 RepID=A0A1B7Y7T7_COLHI|nr:hypothetical protein CH63R_09620 [Colletotrichum higginsianum IMI 349063]OBR08099.1 hypothetical protein CH63R_09620 [Colletotrichum higginsianum IMI 349063]